MGRHPVSSTASDGDAMAALDVAEMEKRNAALRRALAAKWSQNGVPRTARQVQALRVQHAMLLAEKKRLQAELLGGDHAAEHLKEPERAKARVIETSKRDTIAHAISKCIDQRVGRPSPIRATAGARAGAAPAEAPVAAPVAAPAAAGGDSPASPAAAAAELAAKREALTAARRDHEQKLRQLEADERALEKAAADKAAADKAAADKVAADKAAADKAAADKAAADKAAADREAAARRAEEGAKVSRQLAATNSASGGAVHGKPAAINEPTAEKSFDRGLSAREQWKAKANVAESKARMADVQFDFSFGGASDTTNLYGEPATAQDNNDDRILQAMARTNPAAYKEARSTLSRSAGGKGARGAPADRASAAAAADSGSGRGRGDGGAGGQAAELVLAEPDYVLSMITTGLNEDDELTDFDGIRYHVNARGQRVVREIDRKLQRTGSSHADHTLERREKNKADVEERKAAAQQRKQDAWLRSLKRGQGGDKDGKRRSGGYNPGLQGKLHDLLNKEKRSELSANRNFIARRAVDKWIQFVEKKRRERRAQA